MSKMPLFHKEVGKLVDDVWDKDLPEVVVDDEFRKKALSRYRFETAKEKEERKKQILKIPLP